MQSSVHSRQSCEGTTLKLPGKLSVGFPRRHLSDNHEAHRITRRAAQLSVIRLLLCQTYSLNTAKRFRHLPLLELPGKLNVGFSRRRSSTITTRTGLVTRFSCTTSSGYNLHCQTYIFHAMTRFPNFALKCVHNHPVQSDADNH